MFFYEKIYQYHGGIKMLMQQIRLIIKNYKLNKYDFYMKRFIVCKCIQLSLLANHIHVLLNYTLSFPYIDREIFSLSY